MFELFVNKNEILCNALWAYFSKGFEKFVKRIRIISNSSKSYQAEIVVINSQISEGKASYNGPSFVHE